MDRITFASSISYNNITQEQCIHENFDKVMLLYNLINNRNVVIEAINNSDIEFNIVGNEIDIEYIKKLLAYKVMNIYNRVFVIESVPINNTCINVTFNLLKG